MRFGSALVEGVFQERLNRFATLVEVGGHPELAHLPNSGRLRELLWPGNRVWLKPMPSLHRRTAYDLTLAATGDGLASVDARLPSALFAEAIRQGRLAPFRGYSRLRAEVVTGESRLDFRLDGNGGPCLVEVKSVTLVEDGVGLFPDAPTERGRRHLKTLAAAAESGARAAVVFVVQRGDAQAFSPHDEADPAFSQTLRQVVARGVEAYAYGCQVDLEGIAIAGELPVLL